MRRSSSSHLQIAASCVALFLFCSTPASADEPPTSDPSTPSPGPTTQPAPQATPAPPRQPGGQSFTTVMPEPKLSPWIFWGGLGLTAVTTAVGAILLADAASIHSEFEKDRTNEQLAEDGSTSQIRARFFFTAGAVLGVATAFLGLFAVKWSDKPKQAATLTW